VIGFDDRLQGPVREDCHRASGDFVIRRRDGFIAYHLAVVVDDELQGVTEVVRGCDLLASTPRQILLQRLLGYASVSYLHVPIAINAAGEKLSKQTHAAPLPGDALPVLCAAWRFLGQPLPEGSALPASVAEFWSWAIGAWNPARLPPTAMLAAPPGFEGNPAGRV
jgi:glutamyl-Q tRNA(Asp) synthetase